KAKTAAEKAVAELKTKAGGLEKDLAAAREKETAAAAAAAKDADDAKKRTAAATAAAKARALEEALAKVGADLGAKEKDLAARADEMGAKEKTLAALAATLGERDAAVARARKEVEARVAAVAKKETDLGAREAELRAAETRLAAERAAVDEARTAAEAEIARLAGAKDAHDKGAAAALAKLDKARAAAEAAAKSAESERAAASKSALAAAGARAKEEDLTAKAATARAREEELAHKAAADRAREEDALKLAAAKRAGEEAAGRAAEAKRTESEAAAKKADLERARAEAAARTAAADKARAEEAAAAARAAGAAAASDRKAAEDAAAKALERRKAADAEAVAAEARLRAAEKAAAGAEKAAGDAAAKMRALGAALAEARGEADKARAEADKVRGDAAAAKADADTARAEAEKMKADAGKATAAAEAERKAVAAAKGAAEKARLAAEAEKASAEKARAAADAEKAATEKLRKEYEAKLASAIAAAKAPPPAAAPPAPAPTVAADKPAGLVKVKDVSFEDLADHSRVTIAFDGGAVPADYAVHAEGRLLVLDLPGARVPKGLERAVDTSAFPSAVLMVSSYNAATDRVRVEVTLREGVLHRVKKEGGTLVWDFNKVADDTALAAAPAAAAAPGPAPAPAPGAPPTMSPSDRPTSITGHAAPVPATTIALPGTEVAGFATAPPVYESGVMAAKRKYTGTPIDLDFKDADIHNLLRAIAEVGRVNIIASEEVSGTVTIRMKNVPWDQALDVILKSKKLGMIREDSIIRVMPIDDVRKEFEEAAEMALGKAKALPLHVRLVPVSFASAKDLVPKVADVLTERGRVEFDERTNLLIVKDIEANLDAAEELVRSLDTETPQVLIEARLVEANNDFTREVGVQWGGDSALTSAYGNATGLVFPSDILVAGGAGDTRTDGLTPSATGTPNPNFLVNLPAAVTEGSGGALGITLGSLNRAFNLSLRLSALEENGTIRIVSAPKIATLDNKEAEISQGTDIPISVVSAAGTNVQFVSARLSLKVKPHITADGSVIMKIDITNDFPDFARITGRGDPTIRKKEAHTELLVKDGETAVIGGIFTRTTTINTSEVPWFGKIPFIGWFFRKTKETDSRTELLVFITPRIINRSATIAAKTGPGDAAVLEPGK
ncbi:MAG TPA: type IV pilus secretin PilQ, partial [Myxococcota bacterium]|nr:type IV pilus secretin PilQ [Myxococcota bacterium]